MSIDQIVLWSISALWFLLTAIYLINKYKAWRDHRRIKQIEAYVNPGELWYETTRWMR